VFQNFYFLNIYDLSRLSSMFNWLLKNNNWYN